MQNRNLQIYIYNADRSNAHKIITYKYTLIMLRNCDAHKIVIYKYTRIMITNYDAHNILITICEHHNL